MEHNFVFKLNWAWCGVCILFSHGVISIHYACFFVIFYLLAFIEQYGSLPPPPPASVLEDPLVTGTSRDPLLPLGVFLFELTLFICIIFYKNIKEIFHKSIEFSLFMKL